MASQLQTIQVSGAGVDLSPRAGGNNTVVGSPATNAETVVCSIPAIQSAVVTTSGVLITAQIAYTVGTSGASARYRIRQGVAAGAGTVIFDSGVTTAGITAAGLVIENLFGFDASPTFPGQAYCLTLTVGSGAATSNVSAASMFFLIV
jgi:hypothetical protein